MNYFDLHCDTIGLCYEKKAELKSNNFNISLDKGKNINQWVQTYAIWIPDELRGEEAYNYFMEVYKYFINQIQENNDIELARNYNDITTIVDRGKRCALLAIEGSAALGGKLSRVKELHDMGVTMMTLTWNGTTEVGDGCMVEGAGGLTEFGKEVIGEMNKCNMIVDISHLSETGVKDVISLTQLPFIATHSNSYSVCNHPRNIKDEVFKEIVRRGGIVGINFYPKFINDSESAVMKELIDHIRHFINMGGESNICMGSDFDGASMPEDLKDISEVYKLYTLLQECFGEELADKICFKNALAFMHKVLDK